MAGSSTPLSIVVVGGSGDLARRKVFPALFALYCQGLLPADFGVYGFSRSTFTDEEFRARITEHLTCRYSPGESCAGRMDEFLGRCRYVFGQYGSVDSYLDLYQAMSGQEGRREANRLFYLAIPPSLFGDVAEALGSAGLVGCSADEPWSRAVIEKPFGRDRQTSDELTRQMAEVFTESQTYRIDHYLGKEAVQNLLVLRFANLIFEPIWNNRYVESVTVSWKEDLGVEGRGGYFDSYGIIRDVVQNHLLQVLALIAMEPPARLDATCIRDAKVQVLRCIPPVQAANVSLGQYVAGRYKGKLRPAYTEDESVPDESTTPTFASVNLEVNNDRWAGIPFTIRAGKGLDERVTEITVRFRPIAGDMFCDSDRCPDANELVIRVQPDEAIYLSIANKVPGMGLKIEKRHLDLHYKAAFSETIPDAYESLLVDVLRGDKSLFIRDDELAAAWDIFTPVLHEIERLQLAPTKYAFGSHALDIAGSRMK